MITTRPLGVASLASGRLEAALHRSATRDDGRGLAQGMRDLQAATTNTRILFGPVKKFISLHILLLHI